jgi:hypothetical protein
MRLKHAAQTEGSPTRANPCSVDEELDRLRYLFVPVAHSFFTLP